MLKYKSLVIILKTYINSALRNVINYSVVLKHSLVQTKQSLTDSTDKFLGMIPQLDKMQNADRVEIRPETKCTRFKRFSGKKNPKATHTTGHIQMSKTKRHSKKVKR